MKTMAFIIMRGWGDYPSDSGSEPARVYLDRERAYAAKEALDGICRKYRQLITKKSVTSLGVNFYHDRAAADRLNPEIEAEYAAHGFDAGWGDCWELVEVELDGQRSEDAA
jgi:hypothetical protein